MPTAKSSPKKTAKAAPVKKAKALATVEPKKKALAPVAKATKAIATKKASPAPASKATGKSLVDRYRTHKGDTGSTEVQIALLSEQIQDLSDHLKTHPKDNDSRRGLLVMVGKRRRLLNYLIRTNEKGYQNLIKDLKLRK